MSDAHTLSPEVIWQLIATFLGVLGGGVAAWLVEALVSRRQQTQRAAHHRSVLVQGLLRNLSALLIARSKAARDRASPSLRFETGHFDATVVSSVETLFAKKLEGYEHILNASAAVSYANVRLDQVMHVEGVHLHMKASLGTCPSLEPYVIDLLRVFDRTARLTTRALEQLSAHKELGELIKDLESRGVPGPLQEDPD